MHLTRHCFLPWASYIQAAIVPSHALLAELSKICQYQLHASRHMAIHKRNSILIVAQRPHQIQSACVLPLREPRKEARRLQWGEHKAGGAHVVP